MKVIAKVDFISADFGNVKRGQELTTNKTQGDQLIRLNLVDEKPQQEKKKGR